jgi:hypothetical protein
MDKTTATDACGNCTHGLKFMGRRRTYWCRARRDKIILTSCKCLWERVCGYFKERDTWQISLSTQTAAAIRGIDRPHPFTSE